MTKDRRFEVLKVIQEGDFAAWLMKEGPKEYAFSRRPEGYIGIYRLGLG